MPYKDPAKQREYMRRWKAARWKAWVVANGPCRRCGAKENLQVDHIDPSKKVEHRIWSWSKTRREKELRKCQVLCTSCHLDKTREDLRRRVRHGSERMYRKYACRCWRCRAWKKDYGMDLRKNAGQADW